MKEIAENEGMSSIRVQRRLEYARGYLELGLIKEAQAELDAIPENEQAELDVLELRVDVYMELKAWTEVVGTAQRVCEQRPGLERAWIAWAYALRELQRIEEAKVVLLTAERQHGATCGVLHYNLACYYCLLGDMDEAELRLSRACAMDASWREVALEDSDLKAMRARIASRD